MIDVDIASRLQPYLVSVSQWRADAELIGSVADQAQCVSHHTLLRVEEISTEIRERIKELGSAAAQQGEVTELDRALLTEVEEALQLVLLEITELGTRLYPLASRLEISAATKGH